MHDIRRLVATDAPIYREIRLESLNIDGSYPYETMMARMVD